MASGRNTAFLLLNSLIVLVSSSGENGMFASPLSSSMLLCSHIQTSFRTLCCCFSLENNSFLGEEGEAFDVNSWHVGIYNYHNKSRNEKRSRVV